MNKYAYVVFNKKGKYNPHRTCMTIKIIYSFK